MINFGKLVTKTDRITAKSRKMDCIRLHLGEPTFKFPSVVREKIKKAPWSRLWSEGSPSILLPRV